MQGLLPASLLLLLATSPPADEGYILGRDDEDFARALNRVGYTDLAEEVLRAIERVRGGTDAGKDDAQLLRIDLQATQAARERDPRKRVALLTEIAKAKEAIAESRKGTPAGDDVLNSLIDLYREIGDAITAAIKVVEDPKEIEQLRTDGNEMFLRVERSLNPRVAALEKEHNDKPDDEAIATGFMLACFSLNKTYYFHALLLDPADEKRATLLSNAIRNIDEFSFEFGAMYACYELYVYQGLCYAELGNDEKAMQSFEATINLRDQVERNAGVYQLPQEAADLVSLGVLQKMQMLAKKGDDKGLVALADEFAVTTPNAFATAKGLAILAAKAEACQRLGDNFALENTAKKMIDLDPRGAAGERGRALLGMSGSSGSGKGLGFGDTLALAESAALKGEGDRAILLCQQVLTGARGTAEEHNVCSQACVMIAALHAQQGRLHESIVALETAGERYGKGEQAPEAFWRAANGYLQLYQQDPRPLFRNRARENLNQLVTRYPQSTQAASAQLFEGKQLAAEQKFLDAARSFEGIPASSPNYAEALYRSGDAYANHVRTALAKSKGANVKEALEKAETLLKKARTELETAAGKTLEATTQTRLRGIAFAARISLANLYLAEGVKRAADVLPLLDGIELQVAGEPEKLAAAWNVKIKALQALDKVDDAIAQLDAQILKDPNAKGVAAQAGLLGRALDLRAQEKMKKEGAGAATDQIFQKAVRYYLLSVAPQVTGKEPLRIELVESVADRLLALGMQFNGVPDNVVSFVDWTGKRKEVAAWTEAAKLYEVIVPLTPSYRTLINLSRTYGFLSRWKDAAGGYAQLFDRERFVDPVAKRIDEEALRSRPELLTAYIEYGLASREVATAVHDAAVLERASGVFEAIVQSTAQDTKVWWQAKYWQLQLMLDRGIYDIAKVALGSLERSTEKLGGDVPGLEERFKTLKAELEKK